MIYERTRKTKLEELYFGENRVFDHISESASYMDYHANYDALYEKLKAGLTAEQAEMLETLFDLREEMEIETQFTHFKEGYKLCMQLVLEGVGR